MNDTARTSAYERALGVITVMTLLGALAGGVILVLRAGQASTQPRSEFVLSGSAPGRVRTLALNDPGDRPFTEPVAVDLAIDPATMALPPLNAASAESPHRRASDADLLMSRELAPDLVRFLAGGTPELDGIQALVETVVGLDGVVTELVDANRDGLDDDGRFTLTATDGSAVCVSLRVERVLPRSQALLLDPVDGAPVGGLEWSAQGPCGSAVQHGLVSDVRVGTTAGTYGGVRRGDVCDIAALSGALQANGVVAQSWAAAHAIPPAAIDEFLSSLTPVVLLRDTLITDHDFANGRIIPHQTVLQRGNAVLVDERGSPRVRCISGSPLRRPQQVSDSVEVRGEAWLGFSLDLVVDVPPAPRPTSRFVLVDVRSGEPLLRQAGSEGSTSSLAGPVVVAAG